MSDEEIQHQAEAFLSYFAKHPEMIFVKAFETWADSKDLDYDDYIRIWLIVWKKNFLKCD